MGDIRFLTTCLTILTVGSVRLTCTEYRSALDQHEYRLDSPGSISFVPRLQDSLLGHSLATNSRAHHVGKSSNRLTLFYICTLLVSNAHDTETNPGPNIYPCGYCEQKVDWSDMAAQCDECDVWYHISCYDIGDKTYSALGKSNVSWVCWKCGTQNLSQISTGHPDIDNSFSPLASIGDIENRFSHTISDSPPGIPHASSSPKPTKPKQYRKPTPKVLVVNFQSLGNKKASLQHLIESTQPDVIIGNETWLDSSKHSSEFFPPDYIVYRKDRATDNHGGVLVAITTKLISSEATELNTECEAIWAQIQIANVKTLYIGSFYRPPDDDTGPIEELRKALGRIPKESQVWLGGDFNCASIDWSTLSKTTYSTHSKVCDLIIETSVEYNIEQIVTEITRVHSGNILDLFFTSNSTLVNKTSVIPGLSDHDIPMIDINVRPL